MIYYHLRYNIYPPPGAPVEKEDWVAFADQVDDQHMTSMLQAKHQTIVTLIVSSIICEEEYHLKLTMLNIVN